MIEITQASSRRTAPGSELFIEHYEHFEVGDGRRQKPNMSVLISGFEFPTGSLVKVDKDGNLEIGKPGRADEIVELVQTTSPGEADKVTRLTFENERWVEINLADIPNKRVTIRVLTDVPYSQAIFQMV